MLLTVAAAAIIYGINANSIEDLIGDLRLKGFGGPVPCKISRGLLYSGIREGCIDGAPSVRSQRWNRSLRSQH